MVTDDDHTILDIISERDIARGLKGFGRDVVDRPLRELMSTKVRTCDVDEPIESVLRLMDEYQIEHVPVTYGIITMLDLVRYRLNEIYTEARALKAYVIGTPDWHAAKEEKPCQRARSSLP